MMRLILACRPCCGVSYLGESAMTGPEHYREAETLLEVLRQHREPVDREPMDNLLAAAQVHATLALAASIGLSANLSMPDQHAWQQAAGPVLSG